MGGNFALRNSGNFKMRKAGNFDADMHLNDDTQILPCNPVNRGERINMAWMRSRLICCYGLCRQARKIFDWTAQRLLGIELVRYNYVDREGQAIPARRTDRRIIILSNIGVRKILTNFNRMKSAFEVYFRRLCGVY
jgi:hypothetical protein